MAHRKTERNPLFAGRWFEDDLALGDWHGQKKINERCWYSGTPETDAFDVIDGGQALLVEIEGPTTPPPVTPLPTGHYTWVTHSGQIKSRAFWARGQCFHQGASRRQDGYP